MRTSQHTSRRLRSPIGLVAVAWAVVSVAGVTAAMATPPGGKLTRNELVVGKVTDAINMMRSGDSDFHIQDVVIDPGGTSGWHTHPGYEYSVVKSGEIVLERGPSCAPVVLKAGQGLFIPENTPHVAHNDATTPAELYVTYTVGAGTTNLRIDAADPCGGK